MPITLTPEEKAELAAAGSLLRPLAGAEGAASTMFHNPKTGQEFINLPIDPYHLGRHLQRGLVMGPASPELQAKWEAGEVERMAADDALMAEHRNDTPLTESPRFTDAVAAAVTQVLEKLGVALPQEAEKVAPAPVVEEETVVETNDPVQLNFFQAVDAPTESDTKLNVSPASRPYLRVVD